MKAKAKTEINWQSVCVQDIIDFMDKKILELEESLVKYKKARKVLTYENKEKDKA